MTFKDFFFDGGNMSGGLIIKMSNMDEITVLIIPLELSDTLHLNYFFSVNKFQGTAV